MNERDPPIQKIFLPSLTTAYNFSDNQINHHKINLQQVDEYLELFIKYQVVKYFLL